MFWHRYYYATNGDDYVHKNIRTHIPETIGDKNRLIINNIDQ